jgi:hypothetical protein
VHHGTSGAPACRKSSASTIRWGHRVAMALPP